MGGVRIRSTSSPSPSARSGISSRSASSKVKSCPICDALISAAHFARHVRNVHSVLPSTLTTRPVPSSVTPASVPLPARYARTVVEGPVSRLLDVAPRRHAQPPPDDAQLTAAARAMYRAKTSLGMGIEGLCAAGTSSVPSLPPEAQRHLAVAIHVAALETQEAARSINSNATFRAHVARVATQAIDVPRVPLPRPAAPFSLGSAGTSLPANPSVPSSSIGDDPPGSIASVNLPAAGARPDFPDLAVPPPLDTASQSGSIMSTTASIPIKSCSVSLGARVSPSPRSGSSVARRQSVSAPATTASGLAKAPCSKAVGGKKRKKGKSTGTFDVDNKKEKKWKSKENSAKGKGSRKQSSAPASSSGHTRRAYIFDSSSDDEDKALSERRKWDSRAEFARAEVARAKALGLSRELRTIPAAAGSSATPDPVSELLISLRTSPPTSPAATVNAASTSGARPKSVVVKPTPSRSSKKSKVPAPDSSQGSLAMAPPASTLVPNLLDLAVAPPRAVALPSSSLVSSSLGAPSLPFGAPPYAVRGGLPSPAAWQRDLPWMPFPYAGSAAAFQTMPPYYYGHYPSYSMYAYPPDNTPRPPPPPGPF